LNAGAGRLRRFPVFYGWVLVATAFVTMGIVVNARTAFSLFFPSILDEFGWSRALTAATFTTGLLASNAFDRTGSYALAFWIAIACSAVSVAAMWLAAPRKVRLVAGRVPR
jgi:hypothetical protein